MFYTWNSHIVRRQGEVIMFQKHRVAIQMKHRDLANLLGHSTYETKRIMVSTLWLWWQSWLLASQRHYYLPPRTGIKSHETAGSSGPQGPQPAWWESWLHLGVPSTMVIPASLAVGERHLSPGLHTYLLITNTKCYWKAPLSQLLLSHSSTSTQYKVNIYPYPI